MPAEEELTPGELRRWLQSLSDGQDKLLDKFESLGTQFVRREAFDTSAAAQGQRIGALEQGLKDKADTKSMEDTRRIAAWALGLVCTVTFGVIVTGILALVAKGSP